MRRHMSLGRSRCKRQRPVDRMVAISEDDREDESWEPDVSSSPPQPSEEPAREVPVIVPLVQLPPLRGPGPQYWAVNLTNPVPPILHNMIGQQQRPSGATPLRRWRREARENRMPLGGTTRSGVYYPPTSPVAPFAPWIGGASQIGSYLASFSVGIPDILPNSDSNGLPTNPVYPYTTVSNGVLIVPGHPLDGSYRPPPTYSEAVAGHQSASFNAIQQDFTGNQPAHVNREMPVDARQPSSSAQASTMYPATPAVDNSDSEIGLYASLEPKPSTPPNSDASKPE